MKNNKKFVLGSAIALALSVGVIAPNLSKADEAKPVTAATQVENGFKTELEAKKAAENKLKTDKVNKSYKIDKGANGNYYYVLSTEEKKVTIDQNNLEDAKNKALEELNKAGITSNFLLNQIYKAKTVEGVEALKAELLKSHKDSKEDGGKKVTIDEWNLENAKEEAIKELKEAGITSDFFFNQVKKAKTIEGVESLKNEILKAHNTKQVNPEKQEEIKNGFDTEREARIAAEQALENDPVNKSYTIAQGADGKYYYQLSPVEKGLEIGYETREEAEAAAKEALEDDKINNDYEISQGADGRYYYVLKISDEVKPSDDKKPEVKPSDNKKPEAKPSDEEKPSVKPSDNKKPEEKTGEKTKEGKQVAGSKETQSKKSDDKKVVAKKSEAKQVAVNKQAPANNAQVKKVNNVNTGVAGLTGVVATLAAASAALFKSKRK